jgi:hypothetical protein
MYSDYNPSHIQFITLRFRRCRDCRRAKRLVSPKFNIYWYSHDGAQKCLPYYFICLHRFLSVAELYNVSELSTVCDPLQHMQ